VSKVDDSFELQPVGDPGECLAQFLAVVFRSEAGIVDCCRDAFDDI
jgi:hypothetical protein